MSETTYEEACRCPKCNFPGEVTSKTRSRDGRGKPVQVHTLTCRTPGCKWQDTHWLVQVNSDGSIPAPYSQIGKKQYPKLSPESETRVREAMEAQLRAELRGDGEVRNPRS